MCTELKHAVSELALCSVCDSAYSNIITKCSECRTVGFPAYHAPPPAPPPLRMSVGGVGLPEPTGVLDQVEEVLPSTTQAEVLVALRSLSQWVEYLPSSTVEQRCMLLKVSMSDTICVTLSMCYR